MKKKEEIMQNKSFLFTIWLKSIFEESRKSQRIYWNLGQKYKKNGYQSFE